MKTKLRKLMWILWPSFLVAGATSAIVFALVDPQDVVFLDHLQGSRQLVYSLGFFVFWLMAALSSALTLQMAPRGIELDEFGEPIE
ncbi:hypothetical protein [Castellaniella sp. S9]|uniref:hypothetical protein n=1 Tax=Castellaniella sp. S9 TaxID=2993652 RepID=UPI0022B38690|nr:hypothetical protein [Castellaniella sp. S9]